MEKASGSNNDFLQLGGKVVIVTGGSAGLGEAIAEEFARQGCLLMLTGRNKDRLEAVCAKCRQISGKEVIYTLGDITKESVQQEIINGTIKAFGRLDVLVNNAGHIIVGDCLQASRSDWDSQMKTNLESIFFLTQIAIPHLIESKGSVVNISSIASECQMHKSVIYSMTKAALDNFTKSLATELGPRGVRVNSVNPGTVITMIYRRGENAFSDAKIEQYEKACRPLHLLGRTGKPSEVADATVYLASPRASFITGQILFVDGGRHALTPTPNYSC